MQLTVKKGIFSRKPGSRLMELPAGRFGIEKKLFLLFSIPILLVIIVISTIVYQNSISVVTKNHTTYMNQLIDNVEGYLNTHIDYVQGILSSITLYDLILEEYDDVELREKFEIYRLSNTKFIDSIYIIYNDGTSISTSNIVLDKATMRESVVYKQAEKEYGIFWTNSYMSDANSYMVVSCARPIRDSQGNLRGVVAIDVNMDKFGFVLSRLRFGSDGKVYITDSKGEIISFASAYDKFFGWVGGPGQGSKDKTFNMLNSDEGIVKHVIIGNEKVAVMHRNFHKFGWKVVGVISETEILDSVNRIKNYSLLMLVLIAAILITVSLFVTRYFSIPIKRIAGKMNKVRGGNLDQKINIKRQDEIGYLANSFNEMTERLTRLINELVETENEKNKSDLKVLQAQINPHFLYNTLYSIDFMVLLNKLDLVHPMIVSLIKLLQASIDKTNEFITIKEELENLENYVSIQKIRYDDKFEVKYDISEDVLMHRTLKLILQPLVENAIFHGIAPKNGDGIILIKAYKRDDAIVFEIIDDGVGMDNLTANRLLYTTKEFHDKGFNSIGVKNVHDRIKLYFGNEWGITIESEPDRGTAVSIRFPA